MLVSGELQRLIEQSWQQTASTPYCKEAAMGPVGDLDQRA